MAEYVWPVLDKKEKKLLLQKLIFTDHQTYEGKNWKPYTEIIFIWEDRLMVICIAGR